MEENLPSHPPGADTSPMPPVAPPTSPQLMVLPARIRERLVTAAPRDTLPPRCAKCNEPSDGKVRKGTFSWLHPALYLIILAALLIYVIVALIVRKKATVMYALCPVHARQRQRRIALAWVVCLLFPASIAIAIAVDEPLLILAGLVCLIGGLVYTALAVPVLVPTRIDDRFAEFNRAGPAFLDSLPVMQGY
ncbi:MAG: hypothetical protein ACR2GY_00110 [Phycisphaerales bacterium]